MEEDGFEKDQKRLIKNHMKLYYKTEASKNKDNLNKNFPILIKRNENKNLKKFDYKELSYIEEDIIYEDEQRKNLGLINFNKIQRSLSKTKIILKNLQKCPENHSKINTCKFHL